MERVIYWKEEYALRKLLKDQSVLFKYCLVIRSTETLCILSESFHYSPNCFWATTKAYRSWLPTFYGNLVIRILPRCLIYAEFASANNTMADVLYITVSISLIASNLSSRDELSIGYFRKYFL